METYNVIHIVACQGSGISSESQFPEPTDEHLPQKLKPTGGLVSKKGASNLLNMLTI